MILVGQLSRTAFNTRLLMAPAFAITATALWRMSHWNTLVSPWQITGPVILQGIGTGLIFPQLSAISMASVPRERMGYASSLFNTLRNTGAAMGISMLTTLFVSHQQVHQSRLAERFSIFEAWGMSRQPQRMPGSPVFALSQMQMGHKQGLAMVYGIVQGQAAILAFNDIYRMLAGLLLSMIPFYFLMRRAPMSVAAESSH